MLIALALGIITGLIAILLINQRRNQIQNIMKLSELTAKLTDLDTKIQTIQTSVDALQASLADVEIPAEAQAALDKLTGDVAALSSDVTPPTP